jgi:hypothetical protein
MQSIRLDQEFAQMWVDEAKIHHLYTTCTNTVGSNLTGVIRTPDSSAVRFCKTCMDRLERSPEIQAKFDLAWLLKGSIKQAEMPFAYNKDFDPDDPDDFKAWLKMRPSHITEAEWPICIAELKLMLKGLQADDRSKLMLVWKFENGLLSSE